MLQHPRQVLRFYFTQFVRPNQLVTIGNGTKIPKESVSYYLDRYSNYKRGRLHKIELKLIDLKYGC